MAEGKDEKRRKRLKSVLVSKPVSKANSEAPITAKKEAHARYCITIGISL